MKRLSRACAVALLFGAVTARAQTPPPAPGAAVKPRATPEALSPPAAPAEPSTSSPVPPESSDAALGAAADVGAGEAEPGLSEAELEELGFSADHPAVDTSIRLSGFMDFGTRIGLNDAGKQIFGDTPSLFMGNINVYLSKNLSETVRTMMEVRFLYLPNGTSTMGAADSTIYRAVANDYSDYDRPLHWGGIELERVYLEWSMLSYLTIRAGQFLTPYGIWNVDHGSPTIITAGKPFVIGAGYFPERQTGLELYGRHEVTNESAIGYHLTLSNGSGPVTEYKDLDNNKALGARAYWEYRRLGTLQVGSSLYYGRTTDANTALSITGGQLMTSSKIVTQYDSLSIAADARWNYHGLLVQAEWIGSQKSYTTKGRTPTTNMFTGMSTYPADAFSWGLYMLAGYRFDWLGVMPYIVLQGLHQYENGGWLGIAPLSAGLNIRPIDSVAVKLEYVYVKTLSGGSLMGLSALSVELAWAF